MTRVLLVGGSGQLGTAIRESWTDCEIVAPPHAQLSLESDDLQGVLADVRPDVLFNAAAFHDVDRCEGEPEAALRINALAAGRAAALARERDAVFVTLSTDYVFDGRTSEPYAEESAPNPLSLYGLSKLTGEHLVARSGARAFVVRTCGLYGGGSRRSFAQRVLENEDAMRVVSDVVASPTFAGHLAQALRRLIETTAYGLYHAVNSGAVSWYDFACQVRKEAGRDSPLEPIAAGEWKSPAVRPRFSALENRKLAALGIVMPPWRDGIRAFLRVR